MQEQPLWESLSGRDASPSLEGGRLHTTEQLATPIQHREDLAITNDHLPISLQTEPTPINEQGEQCTDHTKVRNEHSVLFGGLA